MQIILVLVILGVLVLVTLGGILVGSLLLGGMLSADRRTRLVAPLFLVVVPASAVGALVGGISVGYFAIQASDNLVFLGPLGGLIAGGAAGLSVGTAGALFWWWRVSRTKRAEVGLQ